MMQRCVGLSFALVLACGGDPCGAITADPALVLGGGDDEGLVFEPFDPGAERMLVLGPQGGMHVWLSARIEGLCPDSTVLERRVVDDVTSQTYQFGRGPVDFVEIAPGTFELTAAVAVILCPDPFDRPVVGHRLRFVGSAIDGEGRRATAELAFVPSCPAGVDCAGLCAR